MKPPQAMTGESQRCVDSDARVRGSGPRILFFSGGSALRDTARSLVRRTWQSIHILSPFDSGGSSAVLRRAFGMPSVGDLRNRLMALSDPDAARDPALITLMRHRIPFDVTVDEARARFEGLQSARHPLVAALDTEGRGLVPGVLARLAGLFPEFVDLRGASVGNLVLAWGYLDPVSIRQSADWFAELVGARGTVRLAADVDLELRATYADGATRVGQHMITGKEVAPRDCAVVDLALVRALDDPRPASCRASAEVVRLIEGAELICYAPGSFWTSVVANLLPDGIGSAIRRADCPKVFVPSLGVDPEIPGVAVDERARILVRMIARDAGEDAPVTSLLTHVVLDAEGDYDAPVSLPTLAGLGFRTELRDIARDGVLAPEAVCDLLCRLAGG